MYDVLMRGNILFLLPGSNNVDIEVFQRFGRKIVSESESQRYLKNIPFFTAATF